MVLYLLEVELPTGSSEALETFITPHVAKSAAAMGRGSLARRGRTLRDGSPRFVAAYELPDVRALEAYLTSREQHDLAAELHEKFPSARILNRFGEQEGTARRGMRHGEEPGAAYVVEVALPAAEAEAWCAWYDGEHIPEVLRDRGFVRARRFRLHEDDAEAHFLVLYDAVDPASVEEFRHESGTRLAEDHEKRFPSAKVERQVWEWLR